MSKKNTTYYLFKGGRLVGPVTAEKVESLRKNREIYQYSWIMDETHQTWMPIDEMPTENPFQATLSQLKERTLSGAFIYRQNVVEGTVKGIHSFGIEVLLSKESKHHQGLKSDTYFLLNLVDETNSKASNANVIYLGSEVTEAGTLLRFNWQDQPNPI